MSCYEHDNISSNLIHVISYNIFILYIHIYNVILFILALYT